MNNYSYMYYSYNFKSLRRILFTIGVKVQNFTEIARTSYMCKPNNNPPPPQDMYNIDPNSGNTMKNS